MKRGFLTPVLMAALVFAALLGPSIVQAQQWAPDIVLSDLQGKTFKLRDYRNKTVLLVFGATWCPACRTEIPHFKQIYATYVPRGLEMAYVNIQENRDKVAKFAEKYALPYGSSWTPGGMWRTPMASGAFRPWSWSRKGRSSCIQASIPATTAASTSFWSACSKSEAVRKNWML